MRARAMITFSRIVTAVKLIWFLIWLPIVVALLAPVLFYVVAGVGDATSLYRVENYMNSADH